MENNIDPEMDFHVLLFSLERSKTYKIARWVSRTIFLDTGILVSINDIMGWSGEVTQEVQDLVKKYTPYVNHMLENHITIFEGGTNPTGIYKKIKEFAYTRGKDEEFAVLRKDGTYNIKKQYVANKPNEIVLVIVDTINLVKTGEGVYEFDEATQKRRLIKSLDDKGTIDKTSEYLMWARDYLGYSPIAISQFNRSISNPMRLANKDILPTLEDFKGSGDTQDDAEVILALFDPMRYKVDDVYGYEITDLVEGLNDPHPGSKKYRNLTILKNSYGPDGVGVGLAFQPIACFFREMLPVDKMTEKIYESIRNNSYFRTKI